MNEQLALDGLVGGQVFDLINYENFNTNICLFCPFFFISQIKEKLTDFPDTGSFLLMILIES